MMQDNFAARSLRIFRLHVCIFKLNWRLLALAVLCSYVRLRTRSGCEPALERRCAFPGRRADLHALIAERFSVERLAR